VRIRLQSAFGVFSLDVIKTFGGNEVEIEDDNITLTSFLDVLTDQSGGTIKFSDEYTDSNSGSYFVLLNGDEVSALKDGLDTLLVDGDQVNIGPVDMLFSGG
jgi:hypothetical protein